MICLSRLKKRFTAEIIVPHCYEKDIRFFRVGSFCLHCDLFRRPARRTPGRGSPPGLDCLLGASQQIPEPQNALPADDLRDATRARDRAPVARRIGLARASIECLRHGGAALYFGAYRASGVTAAAAIDPASDRALTFAGNAGGDDSAGSGVCLRSGRLSGAALSDLAVSFHLDAPPAQETGHPGSRATSYYAHGDHVGAADLTDAKKVDHWYQLAEIDVRTAAKAAVVVALGDSITDGHGATTNGNDRWTDVLAARLQQKKDAAISASRTRVSAAIICSPTASDPTCWRASIAMCWRRRAHAG